MRDEPSALQCVKGPAQNQGADAGASGNARTRCCAPSSSDGAQKRNRLPPGIVHGGKASFMNLILVYRANSLENAVASQPASFLSALVVGGLSGSGRLPPRPR